MRNKEPVKELTLSLPHILFLLFIFLFFYFLGEGGMEKTKHQNVKQIWFGPYSFIKSEDLNGLWIRICTW